MPLIAARDSMKDTITPESKITYEAPEGEDTQGFWDKVTDYSNAYQAHLKENLVTSKLAVSTYMKFENARDDIMRWYNGEELDPNYDPLDDVAGFEEYASEFVDCKTPEETFRVKKRIAMELRHKEEMAKVPGAVNFGLALLSGVSDVTNLVAIPGGSTVGLVKGALTGAGKALLANAATEFLNKEMSYTYTNEEYAQNVLIGTLLGGVFGGIGGTLNAHAKKAFIDNVRKEIFDGEHLREKGKTLDAEVEKPLSERLDEGDLSLESVDKALTVDYEKGSIGAAIAKLGDAPKIEEKNWAVKATVWIDKIFNVNSRMSTSYNRFVREFANNTMESPYYKEGGQINVQNLEALKRQVYGKASDFQYELMEIYKKSVGEGYNPLKDAAHTIGFGYKGKTPSDLMSEAFDVLRGKKTDNPYAKKAADAWKNYITPISQQLVDAGIIPAEALQKGTYVPLNFDKSLIAQDLDGFTEAVSKQLSQKYRKVFVEKDKNGKTQWQNINETLEQERTNLMNDDAQIKEINKGLKERRAKIYFKEQNLKEMEAQGHLLSNEINAKLKQIAKIDYKISALTHESAFTEDLSFAKAIRHGLTDDRKPLSLTGYMKKYKIMIDDPKHLLSDNLDSFSIQKTKNTHYKAHPDDYEVFSLDYLREHFNEDFAEYGDDFFKDVNDIVNRLENDITGNRTWMPGTEQNVALMESINQAREVLERLGKDYTKMTPAEISATLEEINNKGIFRRGYVNKVRKEIWSKLSDTQKKEVDRLTKSIEELRERYRKTKEELADLKNKNKEEMVHRQLIKEQSAESKRRVKNMARFVADYEDAERIDWTDPEAMNFESKKLADEILYPNEKATGGADLTPEVRGALKSRKLMSNDIGDLDRFLNKDLSSLLRPVIKEQLDLNVMEMFGDIGASRQRTKINDRFDAIRHGLVARLKETTNEKDISKLKKRIAKVDKDRIKANDDFNLVLERLRDINPRSARYNQKVVNFLNGFKHFNILTSLGRVLVASIPDQGGIMLKTDLQSYLPTMEKGLFKFFNKDLIKTFADVPEVATGSIEFFHNFREYNVADVLDMHSDGRVLQTMKGFTDVFMNVVGMSRWNAVSKVQAGFAYMNRFYKLGDKLRNNKALTKGERHWLDLYGWKDQEVLDAMEQFEKFGDVGESRLHIDSLRQRYANSKRWEDRELADKFQLGINKIMNEAVITPGMEKAKVFDDPIVSTSLQFKQFMMSANSRLLIPTLQNAGTYETAQGMLYMWSLGMIAATAKAALGGRDISTGEIITEGMAQTGIYSWTEEGYDLLNAVSHGGGDRLLALATNGFLGDEDGMNTYQANQQLYSRLGVTASKIKDMAYILGSVTDKKPKWGKSQKYALKRLTPMQNTIYLDYILRQIIQETSK